MSPPEFTAYLAAEGFVDELADELGDVTDVIGRLVLAPGPPRPAVWAANVWLDPRRLRVESIADAARQLRRIQRDWALHSVHLHRRAALIAAELPVVRSPPLPFPSPLPPRAPGSWTLLDAHTVLAAPHCSSPFPNGAIAFRENRTDPPSRAYLKLWELFTRLQIRPAAGARCVDLGASPGGWTWALQRLGAQVVAVDKAPLDRRVARLPGVRTVAQSAFAVGPAEVGPVDWLFSDIVCYPRRLLKLVERWMAAGTSRNFVCTIKFQGATDRAVVEAFAALPGSRLVHLHHNRHELTWIRLAPDRAMPEWI